MSTSAKSATMTPPSSTLTRGGNLAILVLRLVIGITFILHGGQKLFGLFGGDGLNGTAGFFASLGANPGSLWAVVVGVVEFFGGIALVVGLLSRLASLALIVDMVAAVIFFKVPSGFYFFEGPHPSWEYNLTMIAALLVLVLIGAGRFSASRMVASNARGTFARFIGRA